MHPNTKIIFQNNKNIKEMSFNVCTIKKKQYDKLKTYLFISIIFSSFIYISSLKCLLLLLIYKSSLDNNTKGDRLLVFSMKSYNYFLNEKNTCKGCYQILFLSLLLTFLTFFFSYFSFLSLSLFFLSLSLFFFSSFFLFFFSSFYLLSFSCFFLFNFFSCSAFSIFCNFCNALFYFSRKFIGIGFQLGQERVSYP